MIKSWCRKRVQGYSQRFTLIIRNQVSVVADDLFDEHSFFVFCSFEVVTCYRLLLRILLGKRSSLSRSSTVYFRFLICYTFSVQAYFQELFLAGISLLRVTSLVLLFSMHINLVFYTSFVFRLFQEVCQFSHPSLLLPEERTWPLSG